MDELLKRFFPSPAVGGGSPAIFQPGRRRARLIPITPMRKKTTIASDIGLTGPMAVDSGRRPPMIASVTSTSTSAASSIGLASGASEFSG